MTTWCYWSGPQSPAIELCLESLARFNPDLQLIDDAWMESAAPDIVNLVSGRSAQVRADLYRLWLLAENGGQWIDADCVALRRLDMDVHLRDGIEIVGFGNGSPKHFSNAILSVRPGSQLIRDALQAAIQIVRSRKPWQQVPYGSTGQAVLRAINRRHPKRMRRCQRWRWAPIRFTDVGAFMARRQDGGHALAKTWHPNARAYHFTGKGLVPLQSLSRDELLTSSTFAGFLFRRAAGRVRPLRAREILSRVPRDKEVFGAEVGVHRGQNASVLLQQRPNLQLHLCDAWFNTAEYRRSGDQIARRSQWQRNADMQAAMKAIAFARDRCVINHDLSPAAADGVYDHTLDFVFIDADHSYAGCRADIDGWLPKIKPGGWIGGHDYGHRRERNGRWGVKRAVDEAASRFGWTIETGEDLTWFAKL